MKKRIQHNKNLENLKYRINYRNSQKRKANPLNYTVPNIWPKIRTNIENFNLIKNFEDQTSPTNLRRLICTVCSRACIINSNLVSKHLFNIDYLKRHKDNLHLLVTNDKCNLTEFIYDDDYHQLNGIMLNQKGFVQQNKLINTVNHLFKMVRITL